jgi:hypothetical protein
MDGDPTPGREAHRYRARDPIHRRPHRRTTLVPLLVLGSLVASAASNLAIGVTHPYPGVALGSGLLLVLERTVVTWTIALTVLVVGDQALKGRLPDEISGRGVRYASREELERVSADTADADVDLFDRVTDLEDDLERLWKHTDKTFH